MLLTHHHEMLGRHSDDDDFSDDDDPTRTTSTDEQSNLSWCLSGLQTSHVTPSTCNNDAVSSVLVDSSSFCVFRIQLAARGRWSVVFHCAVMVVRRAAQLQKSTRVVLGRRQSQPLGAIIGKSVYRYNTQPRRSSPALSSDSDQLSQQQPASLRLILTFIPPAGSFRETRQPSRFRLRLQSSTGVKESRRNTVSASLGSSDFQGLSDPWLVLG